MSTATKISLPERRIHGYEILCLMSMICATRFEIIAANQSNEQQGGRTHATVEVRVARPQRFSDVLWKGGESSMIVDKRKVPPSGQRDHITG
jgi:hypothetical protein